MAIFNTNISQSSVVTQLRCGGIVNEDFVANLLVNLSVKVKELWKSVNILAKLWATLQWLVFYWLTVQTSRRGINW